MMRLIDIIYSDIWYITIITIVAFFVCIGFAFKNPFKKRWANLGYKAILYIIPCLIMLLPTFCYIGLADDFNKIFLGKTTICLQEVYEQGGGETVSETVYRLHVVNRKTGEYVYRKYFGNYSQLLGMKGDTVAYLYNGDLVVLNTATLKTVYTIAKDEWPGRYPELSAGIDQVTHNQHSDYAVKPFLMLTGKNAHHYWVDPFTLQLTNTEPDKRYPNEFESTKYDLCLSRRAGSYKCYLGQEYTRETNLKKLSIADYGRQFITGAGDQTYIEPFYLCIDTVKKYFVFGHYTTVDMDAYTLEARDFSFKPLWKKTAADMETNDAYNDNNTITTWKKSGDILYFNSGGFMLAMEAATGKLIWKTRL